MKKIFGALVFLLTGMAIYGQQHVRVNSLPPQSVIGTSNATSMQGVPISTTLPQANQCLIYNGTYWAPLSCAPGGGGGGSGANNSLSNLAAVAVNSPLLPASAGGQPLGSAVLPFGDLFIGGVANQAVDFNVAGLTANRVITVPDASGTLMYIATPVTVSQLPLTTPGDLLTITGASLSRFPIGADGTCLGASGGVLVYTACGGGGGGGGSTGTVLSCSQFSLGIFPNSGLNPVIGCGEISTDPTLQSLNIPGSITVGGGGAAGELTGVLQPSGCAAPGAGLIAFFLGDSVSGLPEVGSGVTGCQPIAVQNYPAVFSTIQDTGLTASLPICTDSSKNLSTTCAGGFVFPQTISGTVNSGGIPYFNTTTQESSSATITANALIKGGGVGGAPASSLLVDNGLSATYSGAQGYVSGVITDTGFTGTFPVEVFATSGGTLASDDVSFAPLMFGSTVTWQLASLPRADAVLTLTGNSTLNIANPINGGRYTILLNQDATGTRSLSLGTGCNWRIINNGGAPNVTLSTPSLATDELDFSFDGTNCNGIFTAQQSAGPTPTWIISAHQFKNTCTLGITTCSINVPATVAGDVLNINVATGATRTISSVSGDSAWTHCTTPVACAQTNTTTAVSIDGSYVASATGGATTITVTLSGNAVTFFNMEYVALRKSGGGAALDVTNSFNNTTPCTACAGSSLTTTGASDAVLEYLFEQNTYGSPPVNAPYTLLTSNAGSAYLLNFAAGTTAPNFTQNIAGQTLGYGLAFK